MWHNITRAWLQEEINKADIIVGFNFKFDYNWLANNGINLDGKRIWDCQTAHYILAHQTDIFPSLDGVLTHWGLPLKLDVVKTEYWEKGITTSEIPWDILKQYALGDVEGTYKVFRKQWEMCTPAQRQLVLLDGADMHVLREMEHNGIKYDQQLCEERSKEIELQIENITRQLMAIYPSVPINFGSGPQLSAFLYGGTIEQDIKVHDGFYKTGARAGQPKFKNDVIVHTLPALYKPLRGSELKNGSYATNEPTLRQLNGNKKIVNLLLELSKLEKRNGTYYKGLPLINKEMNWEEGVLHSNFNLTQTKTSRLSSSKPNQQNFDSEILDVFVSRFND